MYTTCPKCSLTLVVTSGDLRAAQGFVRCGRCSNVFNAIANLSEDRAANADTSATGQQRTLQQPTSATGQQRILQQSTSATGQQRILQQSTSATGQQRILQQPSAPPPPPPAPPPPPREVAESGTPEESPRYEDSSAVLTRAPVRQAPQTQFDPPPAPPPMRVAPQPAAPAPSAPQAFGRPAPQAPAQNAPMRAPVQQPPRQPQAPQQGFTQPAQQFSPSPQQPPSSSQFLPQPTQARGRALPPPTAEDLDDIPDISLEFDADTADISQVFVQQPARRLAFDGNTGTFETLTLKEPPPEEADPADAEFDSQLRALAAQLAPTPQPPQQVPQQAPAPQARSAPTPPRPAPAPARQTQAAPAQVAPQAKQAPPAPQPQNREPPPAPRPPPPPPPAPPAPEDLDDIPVEDVEVVVRQSTGAPSASPPPARQAPSAPQASNAPSAAPQPQARPPQPKGKSKPPREAPPAKKKAASQAKRAAPDRKGRSPEELIQAAAEVVKRAGRKPAVADAVDEEMYVDDGEQNLDVVPDISESFPTRMRRRAFEAIEADGAALRARIPSLSWGTAAVALSALFVLQVINHYRNELATSDRLRKPLTSLYGAFGVTLVPRWDIGAYEVRQLGALAGAGNLLTVRLSVKNGAKSAQPLPYLRVTVQDRYGNRIASRDVPPKVYAPKRARTLLNADSRIDAEVAFVDPGQNAVGFEIDACLPTDSGRIACANDQIAR